MDSYNNGIIMNEQELRRLSDCEVQINKYINELRRFQEQVVDYNKKIISMEEFLKLWEDFNSRTSRDFGMVRKEISDLDKKFTDDLSRIKAQSNDFQNYVSTQNEKIAELNRSVNLVQQVQDRHSSQHMEHGNKAEHIINRIVECEKFHPELLKYKEYVKAVHEGIYKEGADVNNRIKNLNNSNDVMQSRMQKLDEKLNEVLAGHAHNFTLLNNSLAFIQAEAKSNDKQLSISILEKLENSPKAETVVLPDFDKIAADQKAEILSLIESFKIDISNAKEKSDVNEMHLKLVDKKLENIYLLLKKQELTQ